MMMHEDYRRVLIDWNDGGDIKTCKVVKAKQACELGNHYHKEKTERFMLVHGSAAYKLDDSELQFMIPFKPVEVNPGVKHTFQLTEGSILLCLVDREYNPEDDFED